MISPNLHAIVVMVDAIRRALIFSASSLVTNPTTTSSRTPIGVIIVCCEIDGTGHPRSFRGNAAVPTSSLFMTVSWRNCTWLVPLGGMAVRGRLCDQMNGMSAHGTNLKQERPIDADQDRTRKRATTLNESACM